MRWTRLPQSGSIPVERSSHSITIIDNNVYLFGGEHDPRVPVGNELYVYSFSDSTWTIAEAKGEAPSPRMGHSAGAVGSVLYIFGGRCGLAMGEGAMNDLYAFDTATSTWTRLQPAGPPPPARSYHTAAVLGARLYVFGGCGEGGRLNDLHVYDTASNTWSALPSPAPEAVPGRGGSCLVAVPGAAAGRGAEADALYVIGGFCGRELGDTHVFSLATNAWCGAACPSCSHALAAPGAALPPRSVFGAAVHACGLPHTSAPHAHAHGGDTHGDTHDHAHGDGSSPAACCCPHAGDVLAYGGEVDPSDKGHDGAGDFCASLMAFRSGPAGSGGDGANGNSGHSHGAKGGWAAMEAGGEQPGPRGWFAAAAMADGRMVVHGGLAGDNSRLGDMYVLDLHA